MLLSKRPFGAHVLVCLVVALALAGCGGATASVQSAPPPVKPTAPFIHIASVTVSGAAKTILTTAPGQPLYYYAPDPATVSACTGACSADWRALIFAGPGAPIAPSGLSGALSLLATVRGNQVEYNGRPLYTYAKDTTPDRATGQGLAGKWFVATPNLTHGS